MRSPEAIACCISAKTRAISWIGQIMKTMYEMNAWMPPMLMAPSLALRPAYRITAAVANEAISCTVGRNSAENQAAR